VSRLSVAPGIVDPRSTLARVARAYHGRIVLDRDEQHVYAVRIDNLDHPRWLATEGSGWIPTQTRDVSVELLDGTRAGQTAVGVLNPPIGGRYFLQGVTAFSARQAISRP
jgi:hypothetical protein